MGYSINKSNRRIIAVAINFGADCRNRTYWRRYMRINGIDSKRAWGEEMTTKKDIKKKASAFTNYYTFLLLYEGEKNMTEKKLQQYKPFIE